MGLRTFYLILSGVVVLGSLCNAAPNTQPTEGRFFSKLKLPSLRKAQPTPTPTPRAQTRSRGSETGTVRSRVFSMDAEATSPLAASIEATGRVYTLLQLRNLARQCNPTFGEFAAARGMAYAEILQARAWSNPELSAGIGKGRGKEDSVSGLEFDFGISQPIEWPGKRRARMGAAAAVVPIVEREENAYKAELYSEVGTAYYNVLLHQSLLHNAETALQTEHDIESVVRLRVEGKEVPELDLAKAQVETMKQVRVVNAHKRRLAAARNALNILTGNRLPKNYALEDTLAAPLKGADATQARRIAGSNHPELTKLEAECKQKTLVVTREQKAWLPELKPGIGVGSELDKTSFGAMLSLAIPLWDRNAAGIMMARADLMKSQASLARKRREVLGDVEAAVQSYETARESIMVFNRDGLREVTAEALRVETALYREGDGSLLSLFEARRTQRVTQTEYYQALYEAQVARVELERALGVTGE